MGIPEGITVLAIVLAIAEFLAIGLELWQSQKLIAIAIALLIASAKTLINTGEITVLWQYGNQYPL